MKIGTRVTTPDGPGIISRIDLPESEVKRYLVRLDELPERLQGGEYHKKYDPAYFPHEVKELVESTTVSLLEPEYIDVTFEVNVK